MFNLIMKDLKLGVHPMFFVLPVLTGALMLVPGWIYLLVLLYFCWITVPNMFGVFRSQNDLIFTSMLPVKKKDMVKARVWVIVIMELLHILFAVVFGLINQLIYPDFVYYFFGPSLGFWGLCFVMLAIFNLVFFVLYYETAYKYGKATTVSIAAVMLFAGVAQWIGVDSAYFAEAFNGSGADDKAFRIYFLIAGIVLFVASTMIAYRVAYKRFLKVEIQ